VYALPCAALLDGICLRDAAQLLCSITHVFPSPSWCHGCCVPHHSCNITTPFRTIPSERRRRCCLVYSTPYVVAGGRGRTECAGSTPPYWRWLCVNFIRHSGVGNCCRRAFYYSTLLRYVLCNNDDNFYLCCDAWRYPTLLHSLYFYRRARRAKRTLRPHRACGTRACCGTAVAGGRALTTLPAARALACNATQRRFPNVKDAAHSVCVAR